jgi:hypothetical protein
MTTKFEHDAVPVCTNPDVGAQVPSYIVDLLEESMAEVVEAHLVECRDCKERYLTVLRVQAAARKSKLAATNGSLAHAEEIARALAVDEVSQP